MKILIVDDKAENRLLLRYLVQKLGHSSIEANNGAQACQLFTEDKSIDLILMDVMMPVMDGLKATTLIKGGIKQHHVAIIFVTALDDQETLDRCLQCGGDDFIPKPVNSLVLSAKLAAHQRVINMHRQLEKQNKQLTQYQIQTQRDLQVVEKIFQQAMQRNTLSLPGFQYYLSPLSMFNGDLLLVTHHPTRGTYVLVGDFTGHGLSAAIGGLPTSDIFFAMAEKGLSIGEIARQIDSKLRDVLPISMFCCGILLNINPSREHLSAWIGGIDSFFIIDQQGELRREVASNHLPLGVHWGSAFDDAVLQIDLNPDDRILCYTDGVTEATNLEGEMLGLEQLRKIVCSMLLSPQTDEHLNNIVEEIKLFRGDADQRDDVTLMEFICSPQAVKETDVFMNAAAASNHHNKKLPPLTNTQHLH